MAKLTANAYGKAGVRLTKVVREPAAGGAPARHSVYEFTVQILLEGDFSRVYTHGDNASCIPTDTMKNTVFALGKKHSFDSPEAFGKILAAHFLTEFAHVSAADITISQVLWERIAVAGKPHDHAFAKASEAQRTAHVRQKRGPSHAVQITGGITGLEVIKTTKSGFTGFLKDQYTTLKETTERIFGTSVDARWIYRDADADFNAAFASIKQAILEVFATHDSLGVQQTIYAMGERVLTEAPSVREISFTMPNQHRLLVNLEPFGLTNANEIFVATDEPYGLIQGTVARD